MGYINPMVKRAASRIRRGLEEALAFAKGNADRHKFRVHVPRRIDVRAIRTKLGMTQEEFAAEFGFSVNTLRHWEQGNRQPEGPTRAYLIVIDRAPKTVQKALRAA
jgi:putative transcriptional regulator